MDLFSSARRLLFVARCQVSIVALAASRKFQAKKISSRWASRTPPASRRDRAVPEREENSERSEVHAARGFAAVFRVVVSGALVTPAQRKPLAGE